MYLFNLYTDKNHGFTEKTLYFLKIKLKRPIKQFLLFVLLIEQKLCF